MESKFKVGDRVRVKSLELYNAGKITGKGFVFDSSMKKYCGTILIITKIVPTFSFSNLPNYYETDGNEFYWKDYMFEDEAVTILSLEDMVENEIYYIKDIDNMSCLFRYKKSKIYIGAKTSKDISYWIKEDISNHSDNYITSNPQISELRPATKEEINLFNEKCKINKMEEKELNLVEILKDVPEGTKLWCEVIGDYVIFKEIRTGYSHPVITQHADSGMDICLTPNGHQYFGFPNSPCQLFPSKENKDWSTFKVEQEIPDKALVECCSDDEGVLMRTIKFYDAKNKCTFNGYDGSRDGSNFDHYKIITTKVDDMPQWAQEAYKKLED